MAQPEQNKSSRLSVIFSFYADHNSKLKKKVIAINLNFKNKLILHDSWASPIAQWVKNVPEMQET